MDALQDKADVHLLALSPDYLASTYCLHEMKRAIARDPNFDKGIVVPVVLEECPLPEEIATPDPLFINLREDSAPEPWDQLLKSCYANLGVSAPSWLEARDEICLLLGRNQSVSLVVKGYNIAWRGLLTHLCERFPDLVTVDLNRGSAASRRGLVEMILRSVGVIEPVPREPEDLVLFDQVFGSRNLTRLAFTHFDLAARRNSYEVDFFTALASLVMDSRLVLLAQSRCPFAKILPQDHPVSSIQVQTVELGGRM